MRGRFARTVMALVLPLGLMGGTRPAALIGSDCFFENYDLKPDIMYIWQTDYKLYIMFTNRGRQLTPAFGYKVAIYRWLAGNKAYSTSYFSLNFAGAVDSNFIQVPQTDCNTTRTYTFDMTQVHRMYGGQKALVKIVYDRVLRDADFSNNNPQLAITL